MQWSYYVSFGISSCGIVFIFPYCVQNAATFAIQQNAGPTLAALNGGDISNNEVIHHHNLKFD